VGGQTTAAGSSTVPVTMLTIAAIPAGSYVLMFTGTSAFGGNPNVVFTCELFVGPALVARTKVDLGVAPGGIAFAPLAATAVVTQASAFTATVQCSPSADVAIAQAPVLDDSRLTALHVGQAL
jgi:hypothetical protein